MWSNVYRRTEDMSYSTAKLKASSGSSGVVKFAAPGPGSSSVRNRSLARACIDGKRRLFSDDTRRMDDTAESGAEPNGLQRFHHAGEGAKHM